MIVLEQGSEADGASSQEGRGSQARLRLQEASRRTGMDDVLKGFYSFSFRRQGTAMVESEKKFADSYKAAQMSMHNVVQNEQEYVMQIHALSTSLNVGCRTDSLMCLLCTKFPHKIRNKL